MKRRIFTFLVLLVMLVSVLMPAGALAAAKEKPKLAAPKITVACGGIATVKITWPAVKNASGYKLYRSDSAEGPFKQIASLKSSVKSYTDKKGLENGKKYWYKGMAVGGKKYADSPKSEVKAVYASYAAPKDVKATPKTSGILLQWAAVKGGSPTGYEILRSESEKGTYKAVGTTKKCEFEDTKAKTGKTYFYKVRCYKYKVKGKGRTSAIVSAERLKPRLATPTVTVKGNGIGSVKVSWKAVEGASGYGIYRATKEKGTYKLVKTLSAKSRSYTDKGLDSTKKYWYQAVALESETHRASKKSDPKGAYASVGAPASLQSTSRKTGILLKWGAVSAEIDGYEILRREGSKGSFEPVGTSQTCEFTDKTAKIGKQYEYQIRACVGEDRGAPSQPVDARRLDPKKPMVAITYDDGPSRDNTTTVLNAAEKYGAHVTFFVLGNRCAKNADLLKRMVSLGCEVGCHGWDHTSFSKLSASKLKKQLTDSSAQVEKATGFPVAVSRPPYGSVNDRAKKNSTLPFIMWNIDTRDWEHRKTAKTVSSALKCKDGDIILMHDIHKPTAAAAEKIFKGLKEKGIQTATVSELAHYKGTSMKKGGVYRSFKVKK